MSVITCQLGDTMTINGSKFKIVRIGRRKLTFELVGKGMIVQGRPKDD